jgi:hypothetical protein
MGIDKHSLNLLRYVTENHGKLGRVITLGRQAIHLGPRASRKWIESGSDGYCESLLTGSFGAIHVDSIDNSDYEGATIVADMNLAIPESIREPYCTPFQPMAFAAMGSTSSHPSFSSADTRRAMALLTPRFFSQNFATSTTGIAYRLPKTASASMCARPMSCTYWLLPDASHM